eukprot:1150935-Pelagomonas_calceolata.AAC.4
MDLWHYSGLSPADWQYSLQHWGLGVLKALVTSLDDAQAYDQVRQAGGAQGAHDQPGWRASLSGLGVLKVLVTSLDGAQPFLGKVDWGAQGTWDQPGSCTSLSGLGVLKALVTSLADAQAYNREAWPRQKLPESLTYVLIQGNDKNPGSGAC